MASKTITQLTALNTVSTNLSNTLFVVYDTETNTTKKATLSQIDEAIERSIQNVTSAGAYANAAFVAANTPSHVANSASSYANGSFSIGNTANILAQAAFNKANTLFDNTAQANVNTLTANTITSVNVISSNQITANNLTVSNNFSVSGVVVQWHQPVPLTSKGDVGDKAGYIAIDNDKIYRCVADYTDGTVDIWRYINFTGGTWG